ncbi:MAG: hypothetical protein A3I04_04080 [Nitrospinae bacterium RIFCSPLOWO2_02_FULL_39_110]|nr:MAG: hypothetical protein A2W53_06195 [Nitrospinae bacterium RIFCSPHIGHO2_02_39_11]OGW00139.1 MAG: hypothetical protein A3D97_00510 [Nitrospinae bacterium RIFCSPHIGHO2_12_FULL_39_42]OGW00322.1 MAG: hypothetical protein A3D20_02870 [Nitrospinae bacterium RIFCSPHIGHO2_02_FULL_39_82]OGW02472.1 MAG: hypothetical protein A2Z59_10340 [Nitrospinae bacterium RIFCSPLOWO2_02_39_17]OGW07102.1 MAG: hypothetical protein A3I04_04080 [Nitrospinae bacterium RIFCSPLOWO2_02_FULL_39_110]OGW11859.1 MAG: hypoth
MNIDKKRIFKKFDEINDALKQVERVKALKLNEFLESRDYKDIAYANLIIITEAVIDICFHITAKRLLKAPSSYGDCFNLLKENNLIPADVSNVLIEMARFRNLMIHRYEKIDFGKVYEIITNSMGWIDKFKKMVFKLVEE